MTTITKTIPSDLTDATQLASQPAADPLEGPAAARHDRHFATDHLMADLKGRSVRGGAVTLAAQAIKFVLQMGSTMVLARLLTPADFGLVAMVTAVTGFVAMFKDAGLSMATVQREHITHEQVSTLFWINVGLSVVLMGLTAALAPAIAWFYGEPLLIWITVAISGTFIFAGLTVQHQALLRRQMQFKKLAIIDVTAMATGVVTAVILGLLTRSYWALLCIPVGNAVIGSLGVWMASTWRPGFPRRNIDILPLLKFGGNISGANLANYLRHNSDRVFVGFYLGAASTGIYSNGFGILMLPIQQVKTPLITVSIASLSRLQYKPEQFRRSVRYLAEILACIGLPVTIFALWQAPAIVRLVLGEQWDKAIPVIRLLAPSAAANILLVLPACICIAKANTDRPLKWALLGAPVSLLVLMVGVSFGIEGVAASMSLVAVAMVPIVAAYAIKGTEVQMADIFKPLSRPTIVSFLAIIIALIVGYLVFGKRIGIYRSCAESIVFLASYFVAYWYLGRNSDLLHFAQHLHMAKRRN